VLLLYLPPGCNSGGKSSSLVRLFTDMSRRVCFVDTTNVTSTLKQSYHKSRNHTYHHHSTPEPFAVNLSRSFPAFRPNQLSCASLPFQVSHHMSRQQQQQQQQQQFPPSRTATAADDLDPLPCLPTTAHSAHPAQPSARISSSFWQRNLRAARTAKPTRTIRCSTNTQFPPGLISSSLCFAPRHVQD
jgi:hypothetical protein